MKTFGVMFPVEVLVSFVFLAYGQDNPPLKLVQTIPLVMVDGRIDHMSADVKGQRLFVAAESYRTLSASSPSTTLDTVVKDFASNVLTVPSSPFATTT